MFISEKQQFGVWNLKFVSRADEGKRQRNSYINSIKMAYLRKTRYRKVLIKIVGKNNLIVFIENHTNSASKASKIGTKSLSECDSFLSDVWTTSRTTDAWWLDLKFSTAQIHIPIPPKKFFKIYKNLSFFEKKWLSNAKSWTRDSQWQKLSR